MTGNDLWLFIALGVASLLMFGALYAVAYGLIARFGMGVKLNWVRSYWAGAGGLLVGLAFLAVAGAAAYNRGVSGWAYAAIVLGGWALLMTAINVLLVRTKEGAAINFIQGFVLQLVPNAILITYAIATRPSL